VELTEEKLRTESSSKESAAGVFFADLLQEHPAEPLALKFAGISAYRLGEQDRAISLLTHARGAMPADIEIQTYLLRLYFARGDDAQIKLLANRILEYKSDHDEAIRILARVLYKNSEFEEALSNWKKVAALRPKDKEAPLQVARIAFRLADFEIAAEFARRSIAAVPDSLEAYQIAAGSLQKLHEDAELLSILPNYYRHDPDAALSAVRALDTPKNAEAVASVLVAMLRSDPKDELVAEMISRKRGLWLREALQFELDNDDIIAARLHRAIRVLDPENRDANAGLDRLRKYSYSAIQDAQEAGDTIAIREHARRLIEIDPQLADAHFALGRLCLVDKDFAHAADAFERCVKLEPLNAKYWLNCGRACERSGRFDKALEAYQQVIALASDQEPQVAEATKSIGNIYGAAIRAGRALQLAGEFEDAWRNALVASKIQPEGEAAISLKRNLLRALYLQVNDLFKAADPAFTDAAKAYVRKNPEHEAVSQMLGRTLMRERDHSEALPVWEALVKMQPDNANYHLQIARCCSWLKMREPGRRAAEAALACDPSLEEAEKLSAQFRPVNA
jgi:tetratricopeptide (TPR) repeat protein